ncbi:MAG: hypothetical protein WCL39_12475 [Armatimonadota bacterium]
MNTNADAARKISFRGATITDQVGNLPLKFSGVWLQPSAFITPHYPSPIASYALVVRVVIGDDKRGHRLAYDASVNGTTLARRDLRADGVGRRSQFVRVDDPTIYRQERQTLKITNTGTEPLFVESVFILSDYYRTIQQPFANSDFVLSFLVGGANATHPFLDTIVQFKGARGVTRAISTEITYATPDPKAVEKRINDLKEAADKLGWPMVISMVSWWGGTPPEVAQRREFQQVCYSETDTLDEGDDLKKLLGERWDIRYGWTTPNVWNSTPWQTMNNPELNALRKCRLDAILPYLERTLGDRALAYITDNEPMYWAGDFPDTKYPVKREKLQADFNPTTIEAAAKDGVTLDPTDGLDNEERTWLYNNLGKYIVTTSRWIKAHTKAKPVYTHAQVDEQFPFKYTDRFRPNVELAAAKGLPSGIEMLWDTDMSALQRIREWGDWGLINREEGDSRPMSQHIAMAAASYAMGASILNSYNWNALNSEDAKIYFNGFTDIVDGIGDGRYPLDTKSNEAWQNVNQLNWDLETPIDRPWATHAMLGMRNASKQPSPITLSVVDTKTSALVSFSRVVVGEGYTGWVKLPFDSLTDAGQQARLRLELKAPAGVDIYLAKGKPATLWMMDVLEERHRSQIIKKLAAR